MLPTTLWAVYALPAYVLWPLIFPIRYGFWPVKQHLPPRTLYGWIDLALGLALIAYSARLIFGPEAAPHDRRMLAVGVVWWGAGFLLRCWAVFALGPNWRMGQDEADDKAEFVTSGPYRFMHHPINAALILVAIGQAFLTGLDGGAIMLLVVAVLYFLIQGRAEDKRWRPSKTQDGQSAQPPSPSSDPPSAL